MVALYSGCLFCNNVCQGKKLFGEVRGKTAEFLCFPLKGNPRVACANPQHGTARSLLTLRKPAAPLHSLVGMAVPLPKGRSWLRQSILPGKLASL